MRGAKAVIQLYPETPQQMELITSCAMRAGFTGGLVVDFPNSTKAKKYFLCLCAGNAELNYQTPAAQGVDVGDEELDENGEPKAGVRFEMGRTSPRFVFTFSILLFSPWLLLCTPIRSYRIFHLTNSFFHLTGASVSAASVATSKIAIGLCAKRNVSANKARRSHTTRSTLLASVVPCFDTYKYVFCVWLF
jgi:hypothetical protein